MKSLNGLGLDAEMAMRLLVFFTVVAFGVCASGVVLAELTSSQETAKSQGIFFYNMRRGSEAEPLLELAARAGDRDSQYFLGELKRSQRFRVDSEARYWYEQAAHQGDVYAMMRLITSSDQNCRILQNCAATTRSPHEWLESALTLGKERAQRGDGEAMFQLYWITQSFYWLEKSAKSGFPEAQLRLASEYSKGKGFFLFHGRRLRAIDGLVTASAEAGYIPAMEALLAKVIRRNNQKAVAYWLEKLTDEGSLVGIVLSSVALAHLSDEFRHPLDLVKAYGLALVATQTERSDYRARANELVAQISEKMTPDQIKSGTAYAENWKASHKPVSDFSPRYEYEFPKLRQQFGG